MSSLRQIRQIRESRLRIIQETSFELNPAWQFTSAQSDPAEPNENELIKHHLDYINPDELYGTDGAVAFIYTTQGRMYYGENDTAHFEIIGNHPELVISRYRLYSYYKEHRLPMSEGAQTDLSRLVDAKNGKHKSELSSSADPNKKKCGYCYNYVPKDATICPNCDEDPNYVDPYGSSYKSDASSYVSSTPSGPRRVDSDGYDMEPRDVAVEMGDLLGRLGRLDEQGMLVSFWNDKPEQYTEHLKPCLNKLMADGYLEPQAQVSTPTHGIISMQQALSGVQGRALTPEEQEQLELYKQLHLMRGKEKQEAMKKLGVGGGGKPHPMQSAMDQAGLRVPGQKWWAPHSESFNRRLSNVLNKL